MLTPNAVLFAAQLVSRLIIEPDVLATHDTSTPHVEMMVAASPVDARRLLATTIVDNRTKTYSSADGGYSWSGHDFEDPEVLAGGSDPQTLYTRRGTGVFVTLGTAKRPNGRARSSILVFRSEDGGTTWGPKIEIGPGSTWDRPIVAIDEQGSIYVAATTFDTNGAYQAAVMRSDDDGRTFTAPRVIYRAPENVVMNVLGLVPLSSGKIIAMFMQSHTLSSEVSSDRGATWSEPHKAAEWSLPKDREQELSRYETWPAFAGDGERIYGVWTNMSDGTPRVELASSKDGISWSDARIVERGTAPQYAPAIATGGGAVAITWFDARELKEPGTYRVRFTASTDHGETFLPSRIISSEVSQALGHGNTTPDPAAFVDRRSVQRIAFVSAADRFFTGGDFGGLAADRDGVFHPFWADSRSGTFQSWTTRVHIARDAAAPCIAQSAPTDISKRAVLVADPFVPAAPNELAIPFRIRNDGDAPISGPITVEVLGFGDGPNGDMNRESIPAILNAPNGKSGAGAVFDYSESLSDLCGLPPGASTRAVVWRLRSPDGAHIPLMSVAIHGVVQ
ncbi:MAG TPA: sialidase family protein [Thermoanaerobaculia bacterium]|jgi:hypothetical protein